MNIDIVERMKQIEIQEQEIQRRKRELDARIRAPATAEKYKSEIIAGANKKRAILEAEAQAEALTIKGEAEAFSIEARAKAEAEGMAQKADAFKDYGKAAKVKLFIFTSFKKIMFILQIDLMMESLPKIAAEVAAPMSQCERITMVMDLDGKGSGPSKVTEEVMGVMANIPKTVAASTGVNLLDIVVS